MDLSPYADKSLFAYKYFIYSPSWQCNAKCRHCFIPLSKRRWGKFERRVLNVAVDSAPDDARIIGITGGEPFDHIRRLYEVLGVIAKSGRIATVVTNGLWAKKTDTMQVLKKAMNLGLAGMAVSLDDYHRPRIKLSDLYKLLATARELGLAVNVKSVGKRSKALVKKLEATGVMKGQEKAFSSFDLERTGAASGLVKDNDAPEVHQCLGAMEPIIVPDGKVFACCSPWMLSFSLPPLVLGDVLMEPLDQILDRASRSFLLGAVIALGPGGLMKLLGKKIPSRLDTRCSLCTSILNKHDLVERLRKIIDSDKEIKKEIAGKLLVYEEYYRPDFLPEIEALMERMEKKRGAP